VVNDDPARAAGLIAVAEELAGNSPCGRCWSRSCGDARSYWAGHLRNAAHGPVHDVFHDAAEVPAP
jgi:hypothetical protein